jgi:hypothetical protein
MNNKMIVGGLFCDLQKVFDCVNHKILLQKLEFYGIVGKFKTLIESYFNRRYQKVILGCITSYNCISSDREEIKCGVPQGSILGPLFFLLYINDLPNIAKKDTKVVLYADDTSVLVTSSNKTDFNKAINEAVRDVNRWFRDNLLSLNLNKTQYLNFKTKNYHNSNTEIIYEHKQIHNSSITKFLGLNLDDTLTWKIHIDLAISKLYSACFAIRSVKPILSQNVLRMIYFSQVHCILNYGIIFWGNSPHSVKVFKMQKRIIRIITNSGNRDSCTELFRQTEILPFYLQYLFALILYTVNNKHLFNANMDVHNYETGNKKIFISHQPIWPNITRDRITLEKRFLIIFQLI